MNTEQEMINFFMKPPADIGHYSEHHKWKVHLKNEQVRIKEAQMRREEFWATQKEMYNPDKILQGVNKLQIKMNGDDNFGGGILETSDRNILYPQNSLQPAFGA